MALLPYDCTRDFLEQHALTDISRVSPVNVHNCITHMLNVATPTPAASKSALPARKPQIEGCMCKSPDGRYEVDPCRGDMVCSGCGVTTRYIVADNCTVYSESQATIKSKAPVGITDWVWASSRMDDDERHHAEVMDCMCNLNEYRPGGTFHPIDDLKFLHALAMAPQRASAAERAVAALLYPKVRDAFDMSAVEAAVRSGGSLPKMHTTTNLLWGELRCKRCNALVETPYEQKRHPCGWGQKKRRRASEVLRKNQEPLDPKPF